MATIAASRDCRIASPEDAAQASNGQVLLTRELFNLRMRNVAFGSWEDLLATLADKPTMKGYLGQHGASSSVIHLDPTRIFGWTATLLINICIWGLVGYFSLISTVPGLVLTLAYGLALWWLLRSSLAPQLAGVLWPLIPVTVSAVGVLLQVLLFRDLQIVGDSSELHAAMGLLLSALPHLAVAGFLLKEVRRDPDRATLVVNIIVGAHVAVMLLYVILTGQDSLDVGLFMFSNAVLLLIGLASVVLALRLFVNPGEWGSVELVSWTLNLGALVISISVPLLLFFAFDAGFLGWLAYLLVTMGIGALGAVSGRSFSLLLCAVGLLILSAKAGSDTSALFPDEMQQAAFFVSFGLVGMLIIGMGQWLQQSPWWTRVMMEIRCALARAFGSQDLPYTWSRASQAPLGPGNADQQ
mmetsp:Transcript_116288/g.309355  ORF Transcript_116288/g.309355 Transcript_116288/m.309355 type:complete len:412 (-) Transcript_116288:456-1691(-)